MCLDQNSLAHDVDGPSESMDRFQRRDRLGDWQGRKIDATWFPILKERPLANRVPHTPPPNISPPDLPPTIPTLHVGLTSRGSCLTFGSRHFRSPANKCISEKRSAHGTNFFFHHPWLLNMKLKAAATNCSWWQLQSFGGCQGTQSVRLLPF